MKNPLFQYEICDKRQVKANVGAVSGAGAETKSSGSTTLNCTEPVVIDVFLNYPLN
jgi:hypothetical protein